ncbi:MAG: hypothetical protein MMC33_005616 [Icmadophila ericetorum]|nr:hypothetical protein [Icmadophila ericetorum]
MSTKLPTRQLGKDGPQPDEDRFAVLDKAYELGLTNWDSADVYMDNEDLIGKWFKRTGKRDEIFIATKFALSVGPDGSRGVSNDPEYIKEACNKSLKRLGIDTIDLYYCHRLSGEVPVEKVVGAMAELVKEGKVRYIGLSEASAESLHRACKVHHIAANQTEYSPFTTDIEDPQIDVLKTCRELGIALVAYSPLGRGFITGQYKSPDDFEEGDFRKFSPRFSAENFPKNLKLVDEIKQIADKKGCTPGQLTLAWLMAQGEDIIPIPGTKKIKYLEENFGALKVKLTEEEIKDIRTAVENAEVHGSRYPAAMMGLCFADTPALE